MKINKKFKLIVFIIVILALVSGIILFRNSKTFIGSNQYLSGKDEEKKVVSINNQERTGIIRKFDFHKFNGKWSLIEINSEKDNKITIEDRTKIDKGLFYIVVLDSDYNIIAKKDEVNESENIDFVIPKDGKYFIRIVGKNAGGTFDIKINSSKDIQINHKDFFD